MSWLLIALYSFVLSVLFTMVLSVYLLIRVWKQGEVIYLQNRKQALKVLRQAITIKEEINV